MKIIQLLNSPNWSAASNYCILASKELIAKGHEVLLLTEPGIPLTKAKEQGIPYDDSIRLNHRNVRKYLHAMKRMRYIINEFQPDIISAHINEGAWMPGLVARYACPKAVIARIRTDIDAPKGHFINKHVHHNWIDHIVAGSELHKRDCHRILDYPLENISVVYGGVDTELFNPRNRLTSGVRQELGIARDEIVLGLVARLSPVKGHEYALEALAQVKKKHPKVRLVCTGYESERSVSWLQGLAQELGVLDNLIYLDRRSDIQDVIAAFDIGIITSIGSEANTRAGLEYIATGKPVVATSVGVIPEVVLDNEVGFIVPPQNSHELAAGIIKLMENPAMRQLMGQRARTRAELYFSPKKFGDSFEEVYKQLLEEKSQ
jgi:glycosyltransferase involved in cell wall biosynthesis